MTTLEGKVAVITGAARGQGRSHAIKLAEEGADIIAIDLCSQVDTVPYPMATPEDLSETVRAVELLGRRALAYTCDVRDLENLTKAVAEGVHELGRLDIVVANAGILSVAADSDVSEQMWQTMIDINLGGVWKTIKAATPHILAGRRGGSMVLISSTAGQRAYTGLPHYVAAKHGVVGLAKAFAKTFAPQGIRVNALLPTNVDTDMIQNQMMYELFLPEHPNPTRDDFAVPARDLQEMAVPWIESIDTSNAVAFLVSDAARYITGIGLPVDAGCLLK
ncbi:mycofactocin-coupled SDR family oxidoreductase [Rhodococcus opacus]|uniref:mycofactocin-coupled SDR family oxidoreductase n=1 Tax=Rhodococcus opacus TaxID=37919 RepID=UPI001C48E2E6|nr:mycofactocin-coupled SDR family oxidoreductase [Rhodococcus opacus]MBV6760218.1 mycofactocin-coupled SDR family oxidoreductase [Rhodococcus opacus]